MYKCVIFDLGYTLVKHNDEIETKEIAKILNIPYSKEFKNQIEYFWKNSGELTKDKIITEEYYCNIIDKMFPYIKKFNISSRNFLDALCTKSEVGIYENVKEVLQYLKEKKKTIIGLSNWFKVDQVKELRNLNILKFFYEVYGWDNSFAKPNPINIKENITKKFKNEEVVLIGNDLKIDILCAKKANIDSIWVNYDNEENKTNINPTYEISNLLELKKIIN